VSRYELWYFLRVSTLRPKLRKQDDNLNGRVERSLRTHPPTSHRCLGPSPAFRPSLDQNDGSSACFATNAQVPSPVEFSPHIPLLPTTARTPSLLFISPNHTPFQIQIVIPLIHTLTFHVPSPFALTSALHMCISLVHCNNARFWFGGSRSRSP